MQTKRWIIIPALCVGFLAAGSLALAESQPGLAGPKVKATGERQGKDFAGKGRPGRGMDVFKALTEGITLTDAQKADIKKVLDSHRDAMKAWHDAHEAEFKALREQAEAAKGDPEKMEQVKKQHRELMQGAPTRQGLHDQIRNILTPGQQATFDANVAKLKEQRGPDGKGNMRRGPMGEGPGMQGRPPHAPAPGVMLEGIELTDQQKVQLFDARREQAKAMKAYRDANKDKVESLLAQLKEAKGDKAKTDAIREQLKAIHENAPKPGDELKKILTDEQYKQFEQNRDKQRKMMMENRPDKGERKNRKGKDDKTQMDM